MEECRFMEVNGVRIRELREEQALSLRALAEISGVTAGTINAIENGKRGAYPATVRKLSDALGVQPKELIDGEKRAG